MRIVLIILAILAGVILILWLGLQVKPKAFTPFPQPSQPLETIPLPAGLPAPCGAVLPAGLWRNYIRDPDGRNRGYENRDPFSNVFDRISFRLLIL